MNFKLLVCVLFAASHCFAAWNTVLIGNKVPVETRYLQTNVGKVRADNRPALYVCAKGGLGEYLYQNGGWSFSSLSTTDFFSLDIGMGKNDSRYRVYAAQNTLQEFSFQNQWVIDAIANEGPGGCTKVADGRNDGKMRIYRAGSTFVELTWTGSKWEKSTIVSSNISYGTIDIGKVRGDNKNRIYAPSRLVNGKIDEFEWSGNSFVKTTIDIPGNQYTTVCIGDGRGDGKNRIYLGTLADSKIYELTYSNNKWDILTVSEIDAKRFCIRVGKGRNDDKNRVYAAERMSNGGVAEYEWTGSNYKRTVVDGTTGATSIFSIGDARGDGKSRLYPANANNGEVYEATFINNGSNALSNAVVKEKLVYNISISNTSRGTELVYNGSLKSGKNISATLYSLNGIKKANLQLTKNKHTLVSGLTEGYYLCRIKDGSQIVNQSILVK